MKAYPSQYTIILGTLAIILAALPFTGYAKDEIRWMILDYAPAFIIHGEDAGKGNQDKILDIIQQGLIEYKHREIVSTMTRAFHDARRGKNVCLPTLIRTPERQSFLAFATVPISFQLPFYLVVKKSRKAEILGGMTPVTLETLLKNPRLKFGTPEGRSYGVTVDALLKPYIDRKASNIYIRTITDLKGFLEMLNSERVDYVIGIPPEITYAAQQTGLTDDIAIVPFRETLDEPAMLYCACAKTEWGRQAIAKISEVILAQRPTERYRAAAERMIPPELLPAFRQIYQTQFLK